MKRSTTAFPVGRPTGAYVCARCQRVQSAAQSAPAVVGAQLDALGHVGRRAEGGRKLRLDRREDGGAMLVLGDLDDDGAVTAVDGRHQRDDTITSRPHRGQVRREPTVRLGHDDVPTRRLAGLAFTRKHEPVCAHDRVHAFARHLEPFALQRRPHLAHAPRSARLTREHLLDAEQHDLGRREPWGLRQRDDLGGGAHVGAPLPARLGVERRPRQRERLAHERYGGLPRDGLAPQRLDLAGTIGRPSRSMSRACSSRHF